MGFYAKAQTINGQSSTFQTAEFLSLCLDLVSIVIHPLLTPGPPLSLSTSPVSGVLDSHCSDQWEPVVLGSLPLLDHQSCPNLHNSPPQAQHHQSYPRRMGTHSHVHTHTHTHTHSPQSQVFRGWMSVLYAGFLSWMRLTVLTNLLQAVTSSHSWHLSVCIMLNSPSDFAEVQQPQARESVLLSLQVPDELMCRRETKCTLEDI